MRHLVTCIISTCMRHNPVNSVNMQLASNPSMFYCSFKETKCMMWSQEIRTCMCTCRDLLLRIRTKDISNDALLSIRKGSARENCRFGHQQRSNFHWLPRVPAKGSSLRIETNQNLRREKTTQARHIYKTSFTGNRWGVHRGVIWGKSIQFTSTMHDDEH